jgi:Endoplasmic Reticulum-Golgi Intermediate Compartment (ERGIC)
MGWPTGYVPKGSGRLNGRNKERFHLVAWCRCCHVDALFARDERVFPENVSCGGISVFPDYCGFRSIGHCGGFSAATAHTVVCYRYLFACRLVTDLLLDTNDEQRVRLNFNITMMDLKCEYAVVDVVSVLGTEQNVSSHVTKWHVDSEGVRQRYQGRNKQQKDIDLFDKSVTETIEELYDNGEDAVNLSEETFDFARKTQEYVFVDFYASWYVRSASMSTVTRRSLVEMEHVWYHF